MTELDSLRGLAAFAVMVHHNLLAAGAISSTFGYNLLRSPLHALADGRQSVMFFFVLSGFVLTGAISRLNGRVTLKRWFWWSMQRTIRLGAPVFAAIAISLACYILFFNGTWITESDWLRLYVWQEAPCLRCVAGQALLVRSAFNYGFDNVLWSLAHEWRISLLLPVIALLPMLRGRRGGGVILFVGFAVGAIAEGPNAVILNLDPGFVGQVRSTVYFILPFAVGAALYRFEIWDIAASKTQMWCGLIAVAALVALGSDYMDYVASALLIWLALQPSRLRTMLRNGGFEFLGRLSFSLYLIHVIVIASVYHALHAHISVTAMFFTSCLLAVPAAFVFYKCFESPAHQFSRVIGSRARP